MLEGGFGVFEFFLAAQVAVFDDEATGFGEVVLGGLPGVGFVAEEEPRAIEMDRPGTAAWARARRFPRLRRDRSSHSRGRFAGR